MRQLLVSLIIVGIFVPTLWGQGGPPGAYINDMEVAADDPNVIIVATDQGVFRSVTAGEIWIPMTAGFPIKNVPRATGNRQVIYAAAREEGVYRSVQGGAWESASSGIELLDILSIAMDPKNTDIVYAGTATGAIYKSVNGGEGWASMSQGLGDGTYIELAVSPVDSNVVFASNISADRSTGRFFRTTSAGQSWENVVSAGVVFTGFGFAVANPGMAYIATTGGVLVTFDTALTFSELQLSNFSVQDVAIDPNNSQIIYAGTVSGGVLKSTDLGASWNTASTNLPRSTVIEVEAAGNSVYAGLSGTGVFRSRDEGGEWQMSSAGMHAADVLALSIDPTDTQKLLASTPGGGIFYSGTGGDLWNESRAGSTSSRFSVMQHVALSPETVYAGTVNPLVSGDGSFLRSNDGGAHWESILTGLSTYALATHPTEIDTVYLGTPTDVFGRSGLIRTLDGGATFERIYGESNELGSFDVIDIEIDAANPQNIYILLRTPFTSPVGYDFARTTDSGANWQRLGVTGFEFTDLAIDPFDPRRIFLGTEDGMFISTDSGANFAESSAGLPEDEAIVIGSIAVDAMDTAVYISTSSGVFKSTNRGANWVAADTGFNGVLVRRLKDDPGAGGSLYAATIGAGVYKTIDGGLTWLPTGGVPALSSIGVVNAATFQNGAVSPGEIVSLFVQNAGPEEGVQATLDLETGRLPTSVADVRVFFNGIAAPLFFVRSDQLNVQVPFEVAGLESVDVRVEYRGVSSGIVSVAIRDTHPGAFAPVLNGDNVLNSERNPAAQNGVVLFFATGQGSVLPAVGTGELGPGLPPFPAPQASVRVLVNGEPATVEFAGLAPGLVGLLQINIRIPVGLSGPLQIQVFIGDVESPTRPLVYVQ